MPIKLPPGATLVDQGGMKLPSGATLVDGAAAPTYTPPAESHPILDFAKGLGEGAVHTMSMADDFATKHLPAFMTTPIGQTPNADNSQRATDYARQLATPANSTQKVGRAVEQAAEFLAPTGVEEGLAKLGGAALGKGGAAAGRILGSGIHNGVINGAQGGSVGTGAATGMLGTGIVQGLKGVAPVLAEKAMGIRAVDRALGKTPGEAIINETTGVKPGTVASQAQGKLDQYTSQLEQDAAASTVPVPLGDARAVAKGAYGEAVTRNNPSTVRDMVSLNDQLAARPRVTSPVSTGQDSWAGLQRRTATPAELRTPIPSEVSATEALALKRGIGDLKTSWNPATASDFSNATVGRVYGALDKGIDASVPTSARLNNSISSLIPVAQRAGATDLNEGILGKTLGKIGRPTGALVGLTAGAYEGKRQTGTNLGAVLGGLTGLVAPEIMTSPTTLMTGARMMVSPVTGKLIPAVAGLGLQLDRKGDAAQ